MPQGPLAIESDFEKHTGVTPTHGTSLDRGIPNEILVFCITKRGRYHLFTMAPSYGMQLFRVSHNPGIEDDPAVPTDSDGRPLVR